MTDGMLPLYRRRWLQVTAATCSLLILLLGVLPYIISYSTKRWIIANGGEQVLITDVDFNPFNGTLAFEGMQVRVDERVTLEVGRFGVQFDWFSLLKHQVHIRAISLEPLVIAIDHNESVPLRIGGIIPPEFQELVEAEAHWFIGIDQVTFANCEIRYSNPGLKTSVLINNLTLGSLAEWMPDKAATLHLDGSLQGAALTIDGEVTPFAEEPQFSGQINLSGLQLERFANFSKPTLTALAGVLTINTQMKVLKDKVDEINIIQKGKVSIDELNISTEAEKASFENLSWEGESETAVIDTTDTIQSQMDGRLSANGIEVAFPEKDLFIQSDSIMSNGIIALNSDGDISGVKIAGGLELYVMRAKVEERKKELMSLESLDAIDISADEVDDFAIDRVVVKDFILAKANEGVGDDQASGSLIQADEMIISKIQFDKEAGLSIGSISKNNLKTAISRDINGKWNRIPIIAVLARLAEGEAQLGVTDKDKHGTSDADMPHDGKKTLGVRIGKILVTGDSSIYFADQTAKPPFNIMLYIISAQMTDIDNTRPDSPSTIYFEGLAGKYAPVNISGTFKPFTVPKAYEFKGSVEGFILPSLSSYTINQWGLEIISGQLGAEFMVMADKGLLDGKTQMFIHQFRHEIIDKSKLHKFESSLTVPLDLAVNMLQDKNNTIHLEVPFSGRPDNLDFNFSDAVNQALASAMTKGALTYLAVTLAGPVGSLIILSEYAGESITKVRLNPVIFSPGSLALESESFSYFEKITSVLQDRPGLNIMICGVAVEADKTALSLEMAEDLNENVSSTAIIAEVAKPPRINVSDTQLLALAKQRADAIKDYLVTELGVAANRLIACKPHIDMSKDDANPRVDLLI